MKTADDTQVISLRTETVDDIGLLTIHTSVSICTNLSYTRHVNGIKIATSLMTDITSKPGLVNTASEVVNVLAPLNNTIVTSQDKLQETADILYTLVEDSSPDEVPMLCRPANVVSNPVLLLSMVEI